MPPVSTDDEIGVDAHLTLGRRNDDAADAAVLGFEIGDVRLHHYFEPGVTPAVLHEKIKEIPLRHECEKLAVRRNVRKIPERHHVWSDHGCQVRDFLVGPSQEIVEQAEFVHELQCRGVDRIAAKIAQEIAVLLEDGHRDSGSCQEKPEHHAGGASPGNRAAHLHDALAYFKALPAPLACTRALRPRLVSPSSGELEREEGSLA